MLPGETILSGANPTCDCGTVLKFQVCSSNAGYYIGTQCSQCGPWSRESDYYKTQELAQTALATGKWVPR